MKKIILALAVVSVFGACKNGQEKTLGTETKTTEAQKPVVVKEVHYVATPPAAQPVQQKKGWSKSAKGAVVGGAGGALIGAAVSKKKGKGAVIGGVIGAGSGYIIGRSEDKKDGRIQ
ncbi:MAG: glycine zipper domain-containing protein [Chitinophagaceae bacterium]